MKKETNTNRSAGHALHQTNHESLRALLDSLIPLTTEELEGAAVRSIDHTEDFVLAVDSFRERQPGIHGYIPYMSSADEQEASENALLCACVRRVCLALTARLGWVPVLTTEDLRAAEAQTKALIGEPSLRARLESLPVVEFIEAAFCGVFKQKPLSAPLREKLMLKILSIWVCFANAYAAPVHIGSPGSTPEDTAAAVPALTPAQFTQVIAASLQRSAPNIKAQIVQDLEIKDTTSNEHSGEIHLQSAYREYMLNPSQRNEVIAHWVSAFLDARNLNPDAPIDRSRVVPVTKA